MNRAVPLGLRERTSSQPLYRGVEKGAKGTAEKKARARKRGESCN